MCACVCSKYVTLMNGTLSQTQMTYMLDIYYADLWLKVFRPGQFYLANLIT